MLATRRTLARVALFGSVAAALVGGSSAASAATPCSSSAANKCTVGVGELKAQLATASGDVIDSGWMESGQIKIRAKFALAPVGRDPFVSVSLPATALVEATWTEKGFIDLKPLDGATGKMDVHYTLLPSIDASIYGISISKDASSLLNNNVQGASFGYDVKASGSVPSWAFDPGQVKTPAPALSQSTIFAMPFSDLGVDADTVEGTLAIQAATSPTFSFKAKEVSFGPSSATAKGASARVIVGDVDALDVSATIRGEVSWAGSLDVKPNVVVDTVAGYPTFGLTKFSFNTVSKAYTGTPMPLNSNTVNLHIPLPNVKVPTAPVSLGDVKSGGSANKTVSLQNTGELEAVFTVTSSDASFKVPTGQVKIPAKGKADVQISYASNGGAASSTITIKSNDPDAPEQSFKIGANGADISTPDDSSEDGSGHRQGGGVDPTAEMQGSGCSVASTGARDAGSSAFGFAGVGLAIAAIFRGRRKNG